MDASSSVFLVPISLNNMGAEFLSQGKIQESQVIFQMALQRLKAITMALQKHPVRNTKSMKVDFHYLTRMPMQGDSETFIFKRPIQLMETKELESYSVVILDVSCAVMFNLTLSFHAQGLNESQHLSKAIMGYMVALKLRRFRRNATTKLFDLGLMNNIAQLHVEKISYGGAMHYFSKVANLLNRHDNAELDAVELDGFMSGVLWRPPTCARVA